MRVPEPVRDPRPRLLLPLFDLHCAQARASRVPAARGRGKPIRLGIGRRERFADLANAGAPAAIGIGLVASRRATNAAQQRLTPGLHIRLPH